MTNVDFDAYRKKLLAETATHIANALAHAGDGYAVLSYSSKARAELAQLVVESYPNPPKVGITEGKNEEGQDEFLVIMKLCDPTDVKRLLENSEESKQPGTDPSQANGAPPQ